MRRPHTIPVPLFIGLVLGFYGSAATTVAGFRATTGEYVIETWVRWWTFDYACSVAALLATAVTLFAVAGRTVALTRTMVQIAAWTTVGVLAWYVAQHVVYAVIGSEVGHDIGNYVWKTLAVAQIGATVALTIAAGAWARSSWVTTFAVLGVIAMVLGHSTPFIGELVYKKIGSGPPAHVFYLLREAVYGASVIVLVYAILRGAPAPTPDPQRAGSAFRRAGLALVLKVIAAVVLAIFAIGVIREPGTLKLVMIAGPMVSVVAMVGFAWCMLDVERAAIADMPRIRLTLGALIAAWAAGMQARQAAGAYEQLASTTPSDFHQPLHWTVVAPIVGIIGMLLITTALSAYARSRGNERLRTSAMTRGPLFAVLSLGPTVIGFASLPERGLMVALSMSAIVCSIASVAVLAGLMRIAAESFEHAATLPVARIQR